MHRSKQSLKEDDFIEFDDEDSKSEDEDDEELQFEDSYIREEYNVLENSKLFKNV